MYYVYAIKNKENRIYVGLSKEVDRRLLDHNSGRVFSTKGYRPWDMLFIEACENRIDAREREKYYKSGIGKEYLKSILPS